MMLRALFLSAALLAVTLPAVTQTISQTSSHQWSIVVHGGAGVIERKDMPPATEAAYRAAMKTAIAARLDDEVEEAVACEALKHMVEERHARLDETAGEEATRAELAGLLLIQTVELAGGFRFLGDVDGFRRRTRGDCSCRSG